MSDDLDAELDAYLDEHDPAPIDDALLEQRPDLIDESRVNALLSKRGRLAAEQDRIDERARERIAPIEAWRDDRTAGIKRELEWIDRSLETYARAVLPQMRRKSLPLPAGVLKLTQPGSPSLHVYDEGEFVAWCLDESYPHRDGMLRRTVAADKAEVKRQTAVGPRDEQLSTDLLAVFAVVEAATGERVPGVRFVTPAVARFTVTAPAYSHSDTTQGDNP